MSELGDRERGYQGRSQRAVAGTPQAGKACRAAKDEPAIICLQGWVVGSRERTIDVHMACTPAAGKTGQPKE